MAKAMTKATRESFQLPEFLTDLKLGDFPVAIFEIKNQVLDTELFVSDVDKGLYQLQLVMTAQIIQDSSLKNEPARKVREAELKGLMPPSSPLSDMQQWGATEWSNLTNTRADIALTVKRLQAKLSMAEQLFSVAKLKARQQIASSEETILD